MGVRVKSTSSHSINAFSARAGGAVALLLLIGLLLAPRADAALEQVATFSANPEPENYFSGNDGGSIAVNTAGAGGVPAGTVYAVNKRLSVVFRYSPQGEFREAWGWGVSKTRVRPFQFERCGPDGEAAHPDCANPQALEESEGEGAGRLASPLSIAVDQATGYVYVRSSTSAFMDTHGLIQVFTGTGSPVTNFLDKGSSTETVDESPEKLHNAPENTGIAVDASGTLYISDTTKDVHRVMVWKPQTPGDYEHYVYTGRANDIDTSGHLALDDAGNLYSADNRTLREFAPGPLHTPVCEYEVADQGLISMTVNPDTGEAFYWDGSSIKFIHLLSACEEGQFQDRGTLTLVPKPDLHTSAGLAFNPSLTWEPSRSPGALYFVAFSEYTPLGYIFAPAEVHLPEVESEQVSSATATTALLEAQINPKGSKTHYSFQYITRAAYEANPPSERFAGASEAPLGGGDLPASQEPLPASASLVGLQPDTEYRYRAIATSHCEPEHEENLCEDAGEVEAFQTFPTEAPGLTDHRARELVSPVQKNGGEVFPLEPDVGGSGARCAAGCEPGFLSTSFPRRSSPDGEAVLYEGFPFSSTEGASRLNEYVSHRNEKTGWQTAILAPALFNGGEYTAFDANLTKGILSQGAPSLTPSAPFEYPNLYTQSTADPSSLTALLTSEPPNRPPGQLFVRYAGASDDLSRIFFAANDALTGETPFAPEAVDGGLSKENLYEWVEGQLRLVNVLPGNAETAPGSGANFGFAPAAAHAISADGSHVFWSDEAGQLYVRINGESTVEIPDSGKFLAASEDGSNVLLNNGHLYGLQTEATTDLTEGQGGFQGIAGQSDDLSHIYFVDTAVLTGEEENERGDKAQAGKHNLYAWREGATEFVATLLDADELSDGSTIGGDWVSGPVFRTAEASPGGRWLAFGSVAPLTGYDNVGLCRRIEGTGAYATAPCREAFLYDSQSGKLICVSCNPSGARPLGRTLLPTGGRGFQPRYLLDSGRLYFDTEEALSPFDTNRARGGVAVNGEPSGAEEVGAEDVYEYEPQGEGTCERAGGCVSLISAGHESGDSNFLATDEAGENVFFTTRDQLSLKDTDDLMDLYDAREGGGIPSETETARGECQGEACQPQVSPPNDPTPGSSAFEGAGNVVEEPAAKKHHKHHKNRHKAKRHRHQRAAKHNRGGAR